MAKAGDLTRGRRHLWRAVIATVLIIGSMGVIATQPVQAISAAELGVTLEIVDNGSGGVKITYDVQNQSADETMFVRSIDLDYGGAAISLGDVQCDDSSNTMNPGQSLGVCMFELPNADLFEYTGPTVCGETLTMVMTVVGESDSDPGDLTSATPLTFTDTCTQMSTSTTTTEATTTTTESTTTTTQATTTTTEANGTNTTLPAGGNGDYEIFKSVDDSTVVSGTTVTYSVTVRNNTANDAVLFNLKDNLSDGTQFDLMETAEDPEVCVDSSGNELTNAAPFPLVAANGGTFTCTFTTTVTGDVGDVITDSVVGLLDPISGSTAGEGTTGPSSDVSVTIIDENATTTTTSTSTTTTTVANNLPDSENGFSITKVASDENPLDGASVTFTVTVTNNSGDPADLVSLTESIDGVDDALLEDSSGAGDAQCSIGGLPASGPQTIADGDDLVCIFGLTVNGDSGTVFIDTVTAVIVEEGADASDTPIAQIADDATVTISQEPVELLAAITKTDDGATVEAPGGTVTYSVTITNPNLIPVTITSLTDLVPGSGPLDVFTIDGSTCVADTTLAPSGTSGDSVTCSFPIDISGAVGDEITDTVSVQLTDGAGNNGQATADEVTEIVAPTATGTGADVSVTKTAADGPFVPGDEVAYTITAANAGPATATGVSIVDVLPDGVSFVRAQGNGWSCTLTGQQLDCDSDPLALDDEAPLVITVAIDDAFTGTSLSNTATVSADNADTTVANDSSTAAIDVTQVQGTVTSSTPLVTTPITVTTVPTVGGTLVITGPQQAELIPWATLTAGLGLMVVTMMSVWRDHNQGIALALPTRTTLFNRGVAKPGRSVDLVARIGSIVAWRRHDRNRN